MTKWLASALAEADRVFVLGSQRLDWDPEVVLAPLGAKLAVSRDVATLLEALVAELRAGDQVVLMSNGSFDGLPQLLEQALASR